MTIFILYCYYKYFCFGISFPGQHVFLIGGGGGFELGNSVCVSVSVKTGMWCSMGGILELWEGVHRCCEACKLLIF
jgi:hypothetical protein